MSRICFGVITMVLVVVSSVVCAEPLKSSLQPGEKITTIFEPINVNGEHAGEPYCLICENGMSPVALLFAREVNEPLLDLIEKLDRAVVKSRDKSADSRSRALEKEKLCHANMYLVE